MTERCISPEDQYRGGRVARQFRFTYSDLAQLFGMSAFAVRQAVRRKRFDPTSLHSIFEFHSKRSTQHGQRP